MDWHHPILSCKESKAFENSIFEGHPELASQAMETAGNALGCQLLKDLGCRLETFSSAIVLLGKGHNAGDALIACGLLLDRLPFLELYVIPLMGEQSFAPAVQPWWERITTRERVQVFDSTEHLFKHRIRFDLLIDGVFGMQFRPPLSDALATVFQRINQLDITIRVAVDLPSGLSDQVVVEPMHILRADFTYATGILKSPLVLQEHLEYVGRLRYLDIGFFNERQLDTSKRIVHSGIEDALKVLRPVCSDKRNYGHLLIVAGSRQMPGALLMCVSSAIRSGVGLVTVVAPESVAPQFAGIIPEAMWLPWAETERGGLALEGFSELLPFRDRVDAILMGPGCGRDVETHALLDEIMDHFDVPMVLDADALTRDRIEKGLKQSNSLILTPHEGEFRRIAGIDVQTPVDDEEHLMSFSTQFAGSVVVLKGPLTRMCDGEHLFYFPSGNPILARGGSGDILAGLVAGKVASGKKSRLIDSVAQGVAVHGRAADRLFATKEETHIRTTDILDFLNSY